MISIIQFIKEIHYLLGDNTRKLPWIIFLFLCSSVLDVAGIGLIVPYVALIVSPENFIQSDFYPIFVSLGMPLKQDELLITLGLVLLIVFIIKTIAALLINRIIINFCFQHSVQLRSSLMNSYQRLPYIDYLARNSSAYIHNVNLAAKFSETIMQSILRLISDGLVALVILILLATVNITALGLLVFLLGGLILVYDRVFRPSIGKYGRLANEYSTNMLKGINEGIEGLKEIRILGKEEYFHKMFYDNAKGLSLVNQKSTLISTAPRYLLELVLITFVVMLVFSSIIFSQDLNTLLPTLSMFAVASMRLAPSANQVISGIAKIRFGRHGIGLLYSDLLKLEENTTSTIASSNDNKRVFQSLILCDVTFSYPKTNQPALKNISLSIHAGDAIGITGTSGAGKTTLVDMLLGLLEPQKGEITVNGYTLENGPEDWRSQVAYLPQQVFLTDNTLKSNVALGLEDNEINENKLKEAIRQARLSDLIQQLPEGVNTMLGERGVRLSGGQRQRVALARAFYHDRNILVMDESTSALDSETEHEIVEEIKHLKGKKTIIIIAHRLTTLQHCERIYRLEHGELVKQGNYDDVVGNMSK